MMKDPWKAHYTARGKFIICKRPAELNMSFCNGGRSIIFLYKSCYSDTLDQYLNRKRGFVKKKLTSSLEKSDCLILVKHRANMSCDLFQGDREAYDDVIGNMHTDVRLNPDDVAMLVVSS